MVREEDFLAFFLVRRFFLKKVVKRFGQFKKLAYLCTRNREITPSDEVRSLPESRAEKASQSSLTGCTDRENVVQEIIRVRMRTVIPIKNEKTAGEDISSTTLSCNLNRQFPSALLLPASGRMWKCVTGYDTRIYDEEFDPGSG